MSTNRAAHIRDSDVRDCPLFSNRIVHQSPHDTVIADIHRGPPVFYVDVPHMSNWVVRRNADLKSIYSDPENFKKNGNTGFAQMVGEDWDIIPTELDPPVHSAFRAALNPVYSPRRMALLDDAVRTRARLYIDQFKDRGSCEFISEFAVPFPVSIFLDLIGLPQDRTTEFLSYETALLRGTDISERTASVRAVKQILLDAIAERKKKPGDDLISTALTLTVDGRPWTDQEVFGHCFNLYLGGLDTVSANIGLHFHHLATHLHDQETMRANDPTANVVAIEELLRAYAAVTTHRIVAKPIEIAGIQMLPGDRVAMSTPIAGRDPDAYDQPNEIRFDRKPSHVTLGHGIHRCLGQHLARRELQVAIEEVVKALPQFSVEPGYSVPFFWGQVIEIPELPLTWS
jgi:cytochrome P450